MLDILQIQLRLTHNNQTDMTQQTNNIDKKLEILAATNDGRFKGIQTVSGQRFNTNSVKVTAFQLKFRDRNSGRNHRVPKYQVAALSGV
jgi:hypothetical protein